MARYILIDQTTGYVFGDTADFANGENMTPAEAVARLNAHIGGDEPAAGYEVYRADVRGSEAVAVCQQGDDPDYIEAVRRDCDYIGYVAA